ncbi:GAF domain-containing sensor histidine kinase [Massilia sp. W12]|uniref:sensor histidine kinase n=1 Tax=Massilia sp. W12 TaxID=3126507 RepID=UPI0030D2E643
MIALFHPLQELGPLGEDLAALCCRAWYLRQADVAQAHSLMQRARALLKHTPPQTGGHANLWDLRLDLIEAEWRWLAAEHSAAQAQLHAIEQACAKPDSRAALLLLCDAACLAFWVEFESPQPAQAIPHAQRMLQLAQQADDAQRSAYAQALLQGPLILRTSPENLPALPWEDVKLEALDPVLLAEVGNLMGMRWHQTAQISRAAECYTLAWQAALSSGQLRRASIAASNVSRCLVNLNDHAGALLWTERALHGLQELGWPAVLGNALVQYAECLLLLGQIDNARSVIGQALQSLQTLEQSRHICMCLHKAGDVALAERDGAAALRHFEQLLGVAHSLDYDSYLCIATLGRVRALLLLEQHEQVQALAQDWLPRAAARANWLLQADLLQALAQSLCACGKRQAELEALQEALAVRRKIDGMQIPPPLLEALADACAALGREREAWLARKEANAMRDRLHATEAGKRVQALQIRRQLQQMEQQAQHLQKLAHSEAERAAALQDSNQTLALLGEIGRQITAQRELPELLSTLQTRLQELLRADYCTLLLADDDNCILHSVFRIEDQQILPPYQIPYDHEKSFSTLCRRERRLVFFNQSPQGDLPRLQDSKPTNSAMFGPLIVQQRVVGVLSIQSPKENAYSEREILIFENLCAYAAIALDNAQAWQALRESRAQLVQHAKLASLGNLVAGVAHEVNTPLGNSLMMVSSMHDLLRQLEQDFSAQRLRGSALQAWFEHAQEACDLLLHGLHSTAQLLHKLRANESAPAKHALRNLHLAEALHDLLQTQQARFAAAGHRLQVNLDPGLQAHSEAQALQQVLSALLDNALAHAFSGPGGEVHISAERKRNGALQLRVADNGCGIAPEHLGHVFDPYFTTRLGQGGNGLGLHHCYQLVRNHLAGRIEVISSKGGGACFLLELPAPAHDAAT